MRLEAGQPFENAVMMGGFGVIEGGASPEPEKPLSLFLFPLFFFLFMWYIIIT